MTNVQRLEDLLVKWREACEEKITVAADTIIAEVTSAFRVQANANNTTYRSALSGAVSEKVREFAAAHLLPQCLEWLAAQGIAMPSSDRISTDVDLALRQWSPSFNPYLPAPSHQIPYKSLALVAAGGAALGCLALTPLSLLLLGQRESGLFVGGVVGSGLAIALISWLSQRPTVLGVLQKAVGVATLTTALGGVVQVFRRQSIGLLRSSASIAACWLVLLVARPRLTGPSQEESRKALIAQIEQLFSQAGDIVLSLCLAHPDHAGQSPPLAVLEQSMAIPSSLADALGTLQTVSEDQLAPSRHLQGAIRSVLQRAQELGYEWQRVPSGTLYDTALEERFDCFDQVSVGQKIETLTPALVCRGKLVKQGMLRSLND
jgi:hypothetical protein